MAGERGEVFRKELFEKRPSEEHIRDIKLNRSRDYVGIAEAAIGIAKSSDAAFEEGEGRPRVDTLHAENPNSIIVAFEPKHIRLARIFHELGASLN